MEGWPIVDVFDGISDSADFLIVAAGLSLLVGIAEVAGAYHDKPKPWRAVVNR